jgi:hypothetical protein
LNYNYEEKKTRDILRNFIEDDIGSEKDQDNASDEDYDEMKNINAENNHKKTNMEKKSEFAYFSEIMNYFSNNNSLLYMNFFGILDSEEVFLFSAIAKFNPETI